AQIETACRAPAISTALENTICSWLWRARNIVAVSPKLQPRARLVPGVARCKYPRQRSARDRLPNNEERHVPDQSMACALLPPACQPHVCGPGVCRRPAHHAIERRVAVL